jgi:FixJ family two-component response regulator
MKKLSKKAPPLICIVDEDDSVRRRLDSLIQLTGYQTSLFDSSHAFLRSYHSRPISCLIVDAHLSGVSGLELQRTLHDAHIIIPMVFVTAPGDAVRSQALVQGAVEVLRQPFTDDELLHAITTVLGRRTVMRTVAAWGDTID